MRQPLTREAISKAARDILVAEGLQAVSLRRVAGTLGVTAPALYAHVADKRDLLQGIVEGEIERLLQRFAAVDSVDSVDGDSDDPVERLRAMCLAYISYGVQNPDLFRAMFLFRPELTAEARPSGPALGESIHAAFVDVIRRATEDGRMDAGDPTMAGLVLWSAAHGVVVTLLAGPPLLIEVEGGLGHAAVNASLTGLCHGALVPAA